MYYNSDREIFMVFIMRIGTNNSKEWFMLAVRFRTIIIECTLSLHKNKTLKYTCIFKNNKCLYVLVTSCKCLCYNICSQIGRIYIYIFRI